MNPKVDFVFKNIFGNENYTEILISFLNSVFGYKRDSNKRIISVKIDNTIIEKRSVEDKYSILDVKATLNNGTKVNIEMQINNPYNMGNRTLYYLSRMYSSQIKEGEDYEKLNKAVTINILNFNFLKNLRYHNKFIFKEEETNEIFTDMLEIHFLELKKLNKKKEELETELEDWMEFLIEPNTEVVEMLSEKVPEIKEAYKLLEVVSLDENSKELYEERQRALSERISSLTAAKKEGSNEELIKTDIVLLTKKMGILPKEYQKQIKKSNRENLEKIRDHIFEIDSLEELDDILSNK